MTAIEKDTIVATEAFVKGDRLRKLTAVLVNDQNTPFDLTGETPVLRMIRHDDPTTVLVDNAPVTVETPATAGVVSYEFTAEQSAAVGVYRAWIKRTVSGKTQSFPDYGAFFLVTIHDPDRPAAP